MCSKLYTFRVFAAFKKVLNSNSLFKKVAGGEEKEKVAADKLLSPVVSAKQQRARRGTTLPMLS